MKNNEVIKSVGYDQQEIINNILELHNSGRPIDVDPCYSRGVFYKDGRVSQPKWKSDINANLPDVVKWDVRDLHRGLRNAGCIIFDPPFMASEGKKNKMKQRFGCFKTVVELWQFYAEALKSISCVLGPSGLLIVKCQDTVNGRRQYLSSNYIINCCRELELECIDLFILLAKSRATGGIKKQCHARKFHSYFLVFRKRSRAGVCEE